jgi:hypothetical protein
MSSLQTIEAKSLFIHKGTLLGKGFLFEGLAIGYAVFLPIAS